MAETQDSFSSFFTLASHPGSIDSGSLRISSITFKMSAWRISRRWCWLFSLAGLEAHFADIASNFCLAATTRNDAGRCTSFLLINSPLVTASSSSMLAFAKDSLLLLAVIWSLESCWFSSLSNLSSKFLAWFDFNDSLKWMLRHGLHLSSGGNCRALLNIKHQTKRACSPLAKKLLAFIDELKPSCFSSLLTLAETLSRWREPLAAMWRFTKNKGITEGFHRKMKLIQRRAYGF